MKHRGNRFLAIAVIAVLRVAATFFFLSMPDARAQPSAERAAPGVVLDPEKQQRIWDYEHTSLVLETHFGKPFMQALRERNAAELVGFFRDGFRGRVGNSEPTARLAAGVVTEHRYERGERADVDTAGFVRHALERLAPIEVYESAKFSVLHIERLDTERWQLVTRILALGSGSGGALIEFAGYYDMAFRFADEDAIKRGKVLESIDVDREVLRTSPEPLMLEVTERVGLAELPLTDNWLLSPKQVRAHRYQVAVADYDGDGWPDVAVGSIDGRPLLLRNVEGKHFENVTEAVGLRKLSPSPRDVNALTVWIDADNDGDPDLLSGYRFYRNEGGERFRDATLKAGLAFERVPLGALVFDYDADGLLDLYVLNQKGFEPRPPGAAPWVGDPHAGVENHLWRNEGRGRFKNVTEAARAGGGRHQTFAGANLFLDDDRYPDLYLANDFGTNVLLRNRGDGTFEDVTEPSGTGDFSTSMGVSAGDLDNDGRPELYVANMYSKMGRRIVAHVQDGDYPEGTYEMIVGSLAGNRLYSCASGMQSCRELSHELEINAVGWAHAPAMVDLDGDGFLDLYATAGYVSQNRDEPDG